MNERRVFVAVVQQDRGKHGRDPGVGSSHNHNSEQGAVQEVQVVSVESDGRHFPVSHDNTATEAILLDASQLTGSRHRQLPSLGKGEARRE